MSSGKNDKKGAKSSYSSLPSSDEPHGISFDIVPPTPGSTPPVSPNLPAVDKKKAPTPKNTSKPKGQGGKS